MDIYKCLNKGLQFIDCVIPHEVNKEMMVQKKKGKKEWKDWNKWGQKDGKNDKSKERGMREVRDGNKMGK